ncbi:MAG: hypothetical protein AB7T06_24700 [Kofleriaceae bacterium]
MTHARQQLADDELLQKDTGDMSEIVDAQIPRVDLVGKAANGTRFLIAKGEQGASLLDADTVRELVTKGQSMTDTAAPAVDAEPVAKADDAPITVGDIIAETPGGSTADSVPGSPEWEIKDAETAQRALGVLARVKAAITWLAGREASEIATGAENGPSDLGNIEDAGGALDFAIDQLAQYAASEKVEAELTDEVIEAIGKAVALADSAQLDSIEQLGPIVKAGRVLSAANEGKIRGAVESLSTVLDSLPSAPEAVEKNEGATVTDDTKPEATADGEITKTDAETPVAEQPEAEPVEKSETPAEAVADAPTDPIEKAGELQIVYDKEGGVVGVVKPEQIQPVKGGGPAVGDKPEADEPTADALDPAPSAEPGTPADAPADEEPVEKGDAEPSNTDELSVSELVKSAAESTDPLAKRLGEALAAKNGEVEALMKSPAPGGPIVNGALPSPNNLRGQDARPDGQPVDLAKAAEQREQLAKAATPAEREKVATAMTDQALSALTGIIGGPARQHP